MILRPETKNLNVYKVIIRNDQLILNLSYHSSLIKVEHSIINWADINIDEIVEISYDRNNPTMNDSVSWGKKKGSGIIMLIDSELDYIFDIYKLEIQ